MKDKDCNDGDTDSGHCVELVTDAFDKTVTDKGMKQLESVMQAKYERLAKNSNCVTTIKERSILVSMPGPTRQDLTRVGNIGVWRIIQWCDDAEAIAEYVCNPKTGRTLLGLNEIYANRLMFAASVKCTIDEELYTLVDTNERTPISGEFGLHNVGNSSMGTTLAIVNDSGKELALVVRQTVLMDESSRKPVPIPDWWKKSHGSLVRENKKLVQSALVVPAENTYKYTLKVAWSDIDSYYHVNYLSYVMFCFDAAMDAVRHGFYVGFFDDILKYNVKTLSIRYINEALAGDILTVVTWQDAQNPRIIKFSIERDGNALVQISMEFFLRANL